jgi:chemotaxis family two-component system sensor kinase Cph1
VQWQRIASEAVTEPARGWWAVGAGSVRVEPAEHVEEHDADEFAFVVAHDLKQPLQGIRAYCELLSDGYGDRLDGEGRRHLDTVVRLCDRLAGSISGLLRYYHSGQINPSDAEVDLNGVVEGVVEAVRPVLASRRASVQVADRLPAVRCDAVLVGEVFHNLISNGLKFNESREPRVEIGVAGGDPPAISVRDNGIGIPDEHHEAVFAIFRRLHGRGRYEGSGAGLAIVRKIVESHGGRIWLQSEPGRGTTFYFTLGPARGKPHPTKSLTRPPHWATLGGRLVSPQAGGVREQERQARGPAQQ